MDCFPETIFVKIRLPAVFFIEDVVLNSGGTLKTTINAKSEVIHHRP